MKDLSLSVITKGSMKQSYRDLNELLYERQRNGSPLTKTELARELSRLSGMKIWPSKLTTLLNPGTYRVSLSDSLAKAIAEVLNQSTDYVQRYYERAAA